MSNWQAEEHWSPEMEQEVAFLWCVKSYPVRKIAEEIDRTKSSVHRCIDRMGLKGMRGEAGLYESDYGEIKLPLIPVKIVVPSLGKRPTVDRVSHVSLHYADVHFPFQDQRALEVMYKIAADVDADIVVDHGDLVDCYQISTHRPPDERRMKPEDTSLQANIEQAAGHIAALISELNPNRYIYLGGNHEDRHERILSDMRKDPRVRHILSLNAAKDLLSWKSIMGLDDTIVEYKSYTEHGDPLVLFDRVALSHGHLVNQWVTRGMLNLYGKSNMFGHTHRCQNWTERNLKGQEASWNIGCMCDINPHYIPFANWHQGFAVVYWHETSDGWLYDVNQVRVHDGRTVFNGRIYRS